MYLVKHYWGVTKLHFWCSWIPRVFDGEALNLQQLSQRVILAVDYVLPLFVIQLLPHDVLTQVVHHLHKKYLILGITRHLQGIILPTTEPWNNHFSGNTLLWASKTCCILTNILDISSDSSPLWVWRLLLELRQHAESAEEGLLVVPGGWGALNMNYICDIG